MKTSLSLASSFRANTLYHPAKVASWIGRAALASAAASLAILILYMVVNGPRLAELAEVQRAQEIERENLAFCQKFGIDRNSANFAACAEDLAAIRRRHAERISEPGLL